METVKARVVHNELYNMYLGYVAVLIAEAGSKKVAMSPEGEAVFDKLRLLNAVNTPTYRKLNELRTKTETTNNKISKIEGYYETWKYLKDKYPKSLIISFKDFISLSYKYDLFSDSLQYYGQDIPLDVLDNLNKVNNDLTTFRVNLSRYLSSSKDPKYYFLDRETKSKVKEYLDTRLKLSEINSSWARLSRLDFYKGTPDEFISEAVASFTRFPFIRQVWDTGLLGDNYISSDSIFRRLGINPRKAKFNLSPDGLALQVNDMLIAAPYDHFVENRGLSINKLPYTYQEKIKLEDPLVFQLLPFGVLVHDKWGEVANDKIFGGIL